MGVDQTPSLRQLAERVLRIEQEIGTLEEELLDLQLQTRSAPQPIVAGRSGAHIWADKADQRRWISDLFAALSIEGAPIGPEALQEGMNEADLAPNELSQGIVKAREE